MQFNETGAFYSESFAGCQSNLQLVQTGVEDPDAVKVKCHRAWNNRLEIQDHDLMAE